MFRVFRQHASDQVGQRLRQAKSLSECVEAAEFQFTPDDFPIVQTRKWHTAQSKAEKKNPKGIHIIGNGAVTPARWHAHRTCGRFEHQWLVHGRWSAPGEA